LAIGGAEDKVGRRTVLKTFVSLAGGTNARIAVVPTASSLGPEVVEVYDALFRKLGAADVVAARPETREDAEDPELVRVLDDVTGIFMTGGNQLKLSAIVNGTAFGVVSWSPAPVPARASSPRTWWRSVPVAPRRSSG
jgi:cyanophycinase